MVTVAYVILKKIKNCYGFYHFFPNMQRVCVSTLVGDPPPYSGSHCIRPTWNFLLNNENQFSSFSHTIQHRSNCMKGTDLRELSPANPLSLIYRNRFQRYICFKPFILNWQEQFSKIYLLKTLYPWFTGTVFRDLSI